MYKQVRVLMAILFFLLSAKGYSQYQLIFKGDFGTSAQPSAQNAQWSDTAVSFESTSQAMQFAVYPGTDSLFPCYEDNMEYMEGDPVGFSPLISFEAGKKYRVHLRFEVDGDFPGYSWMLRFVRRQADGSFYCDASEDSLRPSKDQPLSILLEKSNAGLTRGGLERDYTLPMGFFKEDGDYAISFMIYGFDFPDDRGKIYLRAIEVYEQTEEVYQAEIGRVLSPRSTAEEKSQQVMVRVKNTGTVALDNLQLSYALGARKPVSQTFSGTLEPGKEADYVFNTPVTMTDFQKTDLTVFLYKEVSEGKEVKDTIVSTLTRYEAKDTYPLNFNLNEENDQVEWSGNGVAFSTDNAWCFEKPDGSRNYRIGIHTNAEQNSDTLFSPAFKLQSSKLYLVSFEYKAKDLSQGENLLVFLSDLSGSSRKTMWYQENFTHDEFEKVYFYYSPTRDESVQLCFLAYSRGYNKGIDLFDIAVQEMELPNQLFMDVDPVSNRQSITQILAEECLVYSLVSAPEETSWVAGSGENAYNSNYCLTVHSERGRHYDEWLVLKPVYLEKGKPYRLTYSQKIAGNLSKVPFQVCLSKENPLFSGQPLEEMPYHISDTFHYAQSYHTVTDEVRVAESGVYYLSFHLDYRMPSSLQVDMQQYYLYLDNISLVEADCRVGVVGVDIPVSAIYGSNAVKLNCYIKNFSSQTFAGNSSLRLHADLNGEHFEKKIEVDITQYLYRSLEFDQILDFSKSQDVVLKLWVETLNATQKTDTLIREFTTQDIIKAPYMESFETETRDQWSVFTVNTSSSWQILPSTPHSYRGNGAAYCQSAAVGLNDYLVSPFIFLDTSLTYKVSFQMKSHPSTATTKDALSVSVTHEIDGIQDLMTPSIFAVEEFSSENYRVYSFYYRPQNLEPLAFVLHATSPAYSKGFYLDNFVVEDSAKANRIDLVLSNFVMLSQGECELEKAEPVRFRIKNQGYIDVDTLKLCLDIYGGAEPLHIARNYPALVVGDSLDLELEFPENLEEGNYKAILRTDYAGNLIVKNDSLSVDFQIHPRTDLPLALNFEEDFSAVAVIEPYTTARTSWYWDQENGYEGHGSLAYVRQRNQNDVFKIRCFSSPLTMEHGHEFSFYARSFTPGVHPVLRAELLEIKAGSEASVVKVRDVTIDTTIYSFYRCVFVLQPGKDYMLRLSSPDAEIGQGFSIDQAHLRPYTSVVELDVDQFSIGEKYYYTEEEEVRFRLTNVGDVEAENALVKVRFQGDQIFETHVNLDLDASTEIISTQKVDLSQEGRYTFDVDVVWSTIDTNGTTRWSYTIDYTYPRDVKVDLSMDELLSPVEKKTYTSSETIQVRLRNLTDSVIMEVPLVATVNQQTLKGTVSKIMPMETIEYTFDEKVDLSGKQDYRIQVFSALKSDVNRENDTLTMNIRNIANEERNTPSEIVVYPNPFDTDLHLLIPAGVEKVQIVNLIGKVVYEKTYATCSGEMQWTIPTHQWEEGLYMLRIYRNQNWEIRKLIKAAR